MSEKDLLISRIVDRADQPDDWTRFGQLAAEDGQLYQLLAETLHDESTLRAALSVQLVGVDAVALPAPGFFARHPALPMLSGWLAAVAVVLLWLGSAEEVAPPRDTDMASHAVQATVDAGGPSVLRELPKLMVETRPIAGSDQVEVIYLRRVLERTVVNGVYTMAHDEAGQPIRARADLAQYAPRRSY